MKLKFTKKSAQTLKDLEDDEACSGLLKQVRKTLAFIETNPRHPSLNTHKYLGVFSKEQEPVFGSYAQNNTPGAYRIFWHYGPDKNEITILAIIPHL